MLNEKEDNDEKLEYIDKLNGNKKKYDYINKIIKTKENRRKKRKN